MRVSDSQEQGSRPIRRARLGRVCAGAAVLAGLAFGGACAGLGRSSMEGDHASISFVSLGGVRDWQAEGSRAIRIQAANGDWYRATFAAPCRGLAFRDSVGFVTQGLDELDRFDSVVVGHGERCWFQSFDRVGSAQSGPAPRG